MGESDSDARTRVMLASSRRRNATCIPSHLVRGWATSPCWASILIAGLIVAFAAFSVLRPRHRPSIRGHPAESILAEYESHAVACLVQGDVSPPLDALDARDLDSIVALLARVLHTYEQRDFDSFLTWHERDLDFSSFARKTDVPRLREYALELNAGAEVPNDWIGALAVFWAAYYASGPPVGRFLPETTRLRLARAEFVAEAWNRSFEVFRAENSENHIAHHLVIPHRRLPQDATGKANELLWMDLAIDFETPHGASARLIARFVWDAPDEEWFLQRAATADLDASGNVPERRHLIL